MAVLFRPDPLTEQIRQGLQYESLTYALSGNNLLVPIVVARAGRVGIALTYTRAGGQLRDSQGAIVATISAVSNFVILPATVFPAVAGALFFSDSVGTSNHTLRVLDQWVTV